MGDFDCGGYKTVCRCPVAQNDFHDQAIPVICKFTGRTEALISIIAMTTGTVTLSSHELQTAGKLILHLN